MTSLSADFEQNYRQFLEQAVDTGFVWGLITGDETFVICESDDFEDSDVMPFWSDHALAEAQCTDDWQDCQVRAIELDDFIDNWLPGMQKDELLVGVNWTTELEGVEKEPLDLSLDLLETN